MTRSAYLWYEPVSALIYRSLKTWRFQSPQSISKWEFTSYLIARLFHGLRQVLCKEVLTRLLHTISVSDVVQYQNCDKGQECADKLRSSSCPSSSLLPNNWKISRNSSSRKRVTFCNNNPAHTGTRSHSHKKGVWGSRWWCVQHAIAFAASNIFADGAPHLAPVVLKESRATSAYDLQLKRKIIRS